MTPIACLREFIAIQDMQRKSARLRWEWSNSDMRNDAALFESGELDSEVRRRHPLAWAEARRLVAEQEQPK